MMEEWEGGDGGGSLSVYERADGNFKNRESKNSLEGSGCVCLLCWFGD